MQAKKKMNQELEIVKTNNEHEKEILELKSRTTINEKNKNL